jgi:hypothetical protein
MVDWAFSRFAPILGWSAHVVKRKIFILTNIFLDTFFSCKGKPPSLYRIGQGEAPRLFETVRGFLLMAKKKFFLIVDTETTQTNRVADFGAVVCDKQGNIHHEIGILVGDFFSDKENHPLFHIYGDKNDVFSKESLPKRYANYENMLQSGKRYLASVNAVNRWLAKVQAKYSPVLTAYNLAFDLDKCEKSGIVLDGFESRFCLWYSSAEKWGHRKDYLQFALDNHFFGNRTNGGHMGVQTKADRMAKFLHPGLPDEPHTALEDARDYERLILTALVKNTPPSVYMNAKPYVWRDYAVRDLFQPR